MDENEIMDEELNEETAPVTEEKNDDKSGGLVVLGLAIVGGITVGRFVFNKGKEVLKNLKAKKAETEETKTVKVKFKEVDESEEEEPEE